MRSLCIVAGWLILATTWTQGQAPAAKNPLEGDPAAIRSGMGLFRARCADCHGMDAHGVRGPDITQVWASGRTDEGLFTTIKNGIAGTEMPAQPRLFDRHGFIWADPHPGNVLFLDDGRLGLLDFGSCRVFDEDEWHYERLMERAFRGDEQAYREGLRLATCTPDGSPGDPEQMRLAREYCDWLWEPLRRKGPFDLGSSDYFPRGMQLFEETLRKRHTRSLPVNTWMNRTFLGVRALCYRLGARVDVYSISEREMGTPPLG